MVALNVPVELEEKTTVPVGVIAVATSVSVTVTVQVVVAFVATELGEQLIAMPQEVESLL
jgi:hypothetical protein